METKLTYRVILKVGYLERYFEFDDKQVAMRFAENALLFSAPSEDMMERPFKVVLEIVDKEVEKEMVENE